MMASRLAAFLLVPLLASTGAKEPIVPAGAPAPVGPYSPGIIADGYLYVSGQGAKGPDGEMPGAFAEQVRQTLDNLKSAVEAAGTLERISIVAVRRRR